MGLTPEDTHLLLAFVDRFLPLEKKEGKLEDAQKMLARGFSTADIIDITGLAEKDILELKNKGASRSEAAAAV